MGNQFTNGTNIRVLDRQRGLTVNKRKGVECDIICPTTPRKRLRKLDDKNIFRQHHSNEIHNEIRGTSSLLLQDLAIQIQNICNNFNLQVLYQYIPGIHNTQADTLSRIKKPLYESSIPKAMFSTINRQWGPLQMDAFAARHNRQLPHYWALNQDPEATAIGALQQDWRIKGLYLHPPWKLITRVLQKSRNKS